MHQIYCPIKFVRFSKLSNDVQSKDYFQLVDTRRCDEIHINLYNFQENNSVYESKYIIPINVLHFVT